MANRNHTLKWINTLGSNKIAFENGIIDGTKNRGIYGIFVIDDTRDTEYCAYIGRAVNIYKRFLKGDDAHFVKLRKGLLENDKVEIREELLVRTMNQFETKIRQCEMIGKALVCP